MKLRPWKANRPIKTSQFRIPGRKEKHKKWEKNIYEGEDENAGLGCIKHMPKGSKWWDAARTCGTRRGRVGIDNVTEHLMECGEEVSVGNMDFDFEGWFCVF